MTLLGICSTAHFVYWLAVWRCHASTRPHYTSTVLVLSTNVFVILYGSDKKFFGEPCLLECSEIRHVMEIGANIYPSR